MTDDEIWEFFNTSNNFFEIIPKYLALSEQGVHLT